MATKRSKSAAADSGGRAAAAPTGAPPPPAGGGPKRQRLLAPLPLPSTAAAGAAGGGKPQKPGKPVYKEPGTGTIQLGGGSVVQYRTDLLSIAMAGELFQQLRAELAWEQRSVRVMGRIVPQPRLIFYMADGPELRYTYSGTTLQPVPWHPAVAALKQRVEAAVGPGTCFNSCLLNYYRDGKDCIGWHSDNERLYGSCPTIASVSLGAPREFLLRRNSDHADKYRFRLGGGALLVMEGSMQEQWMHSIPRREQLPGERISLTFRRILFPERQAAAPDSEARA